MAASVEVSVQANNGAGAGLVAQPDIRHTENHLPCIWGDFFASFSVENSVIEEKMKEIEGFKEEVRKMLVDGSANKVSERIGFIYTLDRLGLSYHFEKEIIYGELEKMFKSLDLDQDDDDNAEKYDLYTTSLMFRVFRHHGFKMSPDVFNKFIDSNTGGFKESLATDIKGMLSLYEASHIRMRGEDLLEEALAFTETRLKNVEASQIISPHLQKQVTRALLQPFYKGFPKLETRFYLSLYEEDESRNEFLLKFAKLDYNLVQILHQQELSLCTKWWKEMEFMKMHPYNKHVRDRLVESYYFALGLHCEPCYSLARVALTKLLTLLIVSDDVYDGYGTIEELQIYTDAINKCPWDLRCLDQLPDFVKPLYKALVDLFMDLNDQVQNDGKLSYRILYSQEAFAELCQANFQEAKVFNKRYIPMFDEYMEVARISSSCASLITSMWIGIDEASEEAYAWLMKQPQLLVGIEEHSRLLDDILSTEFEPKATGVQCYMKQYDVSRKVAVDKLWEMVSGAWKDIIDEWLNPVFPAPVLETLVSLARFMDAMYKEDDGFDHPKLYEEYVRECLIDPVPV